MQRDEFLSHFQGVRQLPSGEYQALCPVPAHDDHNASLSIKQEGDRMLVHDHGGDSTEAVLEAVGLKLSDLFIEAGGNGKKPLGRIVATYDYTDAEGKLLHQTVRYPTKPDGTKDFRQRRPDGKGGYIYNLQGVEPVIYRLPAVREAVRKGEPIFVVEGEKDVHSLEGIGLVATCNPMGAGKWKDSYSEELRGASCVVLPDNDGPGRKHGVEVANSLSGKAASIKFIGLPGLPDKGDITDWLAGGGTEEKFFALVEQAAEWQPTEDQPEEFLPSVLTHAELVQGELPAVEWAVVNLIPAGGISVIGGDSGVGKSRLALHLAQSVASGQAFLGTFPVTPGKVLVLDAESGPNLLERRVKKLFAGLRSENADADISEGLPITFLTAAVRFKAETAGQFAEYLTREGIGLVICDPLIHYCGAEENSAEGMASFFESIREIANQASCTFIFTHHSRKESRLASNAAGQMLRGSSAIRAILDSHLFIRKLKAGKLLVEHDKCRVAEVVPPFVIEITDTDDQTTVCRYVGEAEENCEKLQLASDCGLRTLADAGGALARKNIITQAKAEGISERTMNDALARLVAGGEVSKRLEGRIAIYELSALHDRLFEEDK